MLVPPKPHLTSDCCANGFVLPLAESEADDVSPHSIQTTILLGRCGRSLDVAIEVEQLALTLSLSHRGRYSEAVPLEAPK